MVVKLEWMLNKQETSDPSLLELIHWLVADNWGASIGPNYNLKCGWQFVTWAVYVTTDSGIRIWNTFKWDTELSLDTGGRALVLPQGDVTDSVDCMGNISEK